MMKTDNDRADMLPFSMGNRRNPVLIFAAIASLLVAGRSPGQVPSEQAAQTSSDEHVPVEVYKAPRPNKIAVPDCIHRGPDLNSSACRAMNGGMEGWAEVNFMVDPGGKPFEVTVTHSTGNKDFDAMAVKSIEGSTFVPGTLNGAPVESGFEMKYKFGNERPPPYAGAKPEFVDTCKAVTKAVEAGDRTAAEAAISRLKITNLYEDAYFGMAGYLYAKKWGDEAQQLDGLLRAIAEEDEAHYLPKAMFKSALLVSLELELKMRLYAEALATFKTLQKAGIDEKTAVGFRPVIEQLEKIRSDDSAYELSGTMPEGNWHLHMFKRHFQAKVIEGCISQVKLRCEKHYVYFAFDPHLQYQVASKDGSCPMELVGAPATRFTLLQF